MKTLALRAMHLVSLLASLIALAGHSASPSFDPSRYNVSWNSPAVGPQDSMPLGNGDLTLNAWTRECGSLHMLVGKQDSYDQNGRLLKVGGLALHPGHRHDAGAAFRQTLHLEDSTLRVEFNTAVGKARWSLWVDALHPIVHAVLESDAPMTARAALELWRDEDEALPSLEVADVWNKMPNAPPTVVPADTVLPPSAGRIGWFHANPESVAVPFTMHHQGLPYDPDNDMLLGRVFGGVLTHPAGVPEGGDRALDAPAARHHHFQLTVTTRHPSSPQAWRGETETLAQAARARDAAADQAAHAEHWREFWQRSWIEIDGPSKGLSIPSNTHPLRIGLDSAGGNRLQVEWGRVSLRSAGDHDFSGIPRGTGSGAAKGLFLEMLRPQAGPVEGSGDWDFSDGLHAEAWIKTDGRPTGRVFDKITAGVDDGFLFDLQNGVPRLIVGAQTVWATQPLPPHRWVHLAASVDSRRAVIRMNGREIAVIDSAETNDAFHLTQMVQLQRHITACAGRGDYPIRFNGSTFTIPHDGRPGGPDYRRWGNGLWWQNIRLPYYAMPAFGDAELMHSLFRVYVEQVIPISVKRTRLYSGLPGAFLPECVYPWGAVFSESYGPKPFAERGDSFAERIQDSGWHKWEWTCAPELLWLMILYFEHTLDESFLAETLIPTARTLLTFFDSRFPDGPDGKMVMHPSMALETWWDTTNPATDVAGITAVTRRLLELAGDTAPADDKALWRKLLDRMPALSTRPTPDGPALAPAERFDVHHNIENPELYPVFPFRLVTARSDDAERALALNALRHRWHRGHTGWRQDDLFMAWLGFASETRDAVVTRSRARDAGQRYPAFWQPNYDWTPDQTHGGVLMAAVQAMVLQSEGDAIHLLPAWPDDWNVSFRLHAPRRTVVQGRSEGRRLIHLTVDPPERASHVLTSNGSSWNSTARSRTQP
jgi:hypothetical protein